MSSQPPSPLNAYGTSSSLSSRYSGVNTVQLPHAATAAAAAHGGSSKKKEKSRQAAADEEEDIKEIIKVYDGNTSFRKRIFRTIAVNKTCSYLAILVSTHKQNLHLELLNDFVGAYERKPRCAHST